MRKCKRNFNYKVRSGVVINLKEHFKDDPEYKPLPSEQEVLTHVQIYSHFYTESGTIPFRQRQSTIAEKLGISRKTVNVAFGRLVEKGILVIKHHARRCNTLMFGERILKAFNKVHRSLHHFGLVQHVEKCCIESIRRKYQAMRQGDSGFAEQRREMQREKEERKRERWRKEREESTGWGFELLLKSLVGMEEKMLMRNRRMAKA